jgi:hypothetical protein
MGAIANISEDSKSISIKDMAAHLDVIVYI